MDSYVYTALNWARPVRLSATDFGIHIPPQIVNYITMVFPQ